MSVMRSLKQRVKRYTPAWLLHAYRRGVRAGQRRAGRVYAYRTEHTVVADVAEFTRQPIDEISIGIRDYQRLVQDEWVQLGAASFEEASSRFYGSSQSYIFDYCLPTTTKRPSSASSMVLARRYSGQFRHMRVRTSWNSAAGWESSVRPSQDSASELRISMSRDALQNSHSGDSENTTWPSRPLSSSRDSWAAWARMTSSSPMPCWNTFLRRSRIAWSASSVSGCILADCSYYRLIQLARPQITRLTHLSILKDCIWRLNRMACNVERADMSSGHFGPDLVNRH